MGCCSGQIVSTRLYTYVHGIFCLLGNRFMVKKLMLIFMLFSVFAFYDFISQNRNVIDLISSEGLLKRWTILIVITFLTYTNFAVTNAAFIYFQF